MPDIFSTNPGAVVAIDGPGIPLQLSVEGWGGYSVFKAVIQSIRIHTENGTQFMHTMQDLVYVYTFGERIGSLTLSGVAFAFSCEEAKAGFNAQYHGLEYVYAYYLRARASELSRPIEVVLGGETAFYAFMVGLDASIERAEDAIGQFTLQLKMIPQVTPLVAFEDEEDNLDEDDGDGDQEGFGEADALGTGNTGL